MRQQIMRVVVLGLIALFVGAPRVGVAAAQIDQLPSWNAGLAKQSIVEFVAKVTEEGTPEFVPIAERIAVFDNDGTLWSEQPMYVQLAFALDRGAGVSSSDTRVGWTLGAGVERKFTPNWSGKLEYLYMDFGTKTYFAGTSNQTDVHFRDQVLRAGINYEWNPTVVAKY